MGTESSTTVARTDRLLSFEEFESRQQKSKIGVLRSQRRHGTPGSENTHAAVEDKNPTETMELSSQPPHIAQDAQKKSQRRKRRRVRYYVLGSSVECSYSYMLLDGMFLVSAVESITIGTS